MKQEGQRDMLSYCADFDLRLSRLMRAYGLNAEPPEIEPGVAAEIL
jgi:hypothetical protein